MAILPVTGAAREPCTGYISSHHSVTVTRCNLYSCCCNYSWVEGGTVKVVRCPRKHHNVPSLGYVLFINLCITFVVDAKKEIII